MNHLLLYIIAVPVVAALAILPFSRQNSMHKWIAAGGSVITCSLCLMLLPALLKGETLGSSSTYLAPPFSVTLFADPLSSFFAVLFSCCFAAAAIYSIGYMSHSHATMRYYFFLMLTESAILGVVLCGTLTGLFLFFEAMAIFSYILIIHEEDTQAMYAGSRYLFMTIAAGLAIFLGLAVTYYLTGRVDFQVGGYVMPSTLATLALFAFMLGFGIKAGMFPLHIWLPEAHPAAPAAFSSLLSGCMIKTGAYGLIRIMFFMYSREAIRAAFFDQVLLWLAVITILLGSALALRQEQLKRRLAYSSVAQIGYILLGIALLSEQALLGALFHIFSHALMKGTLFLCAGSITTATGKKNIRDMAGIGMKMPITMIAFTFASMSIVGIPPFNAFYSKWHLASASLQGGYGILVAVLIASSLLNALYYFPIVIQAFFPKNEVSHEEGWLWDNLPLSMVFSTVILAAACFAFAFFQPNWPLVFAQKIATYLF